MLPNLLFISTLFSIIFTHSYSQCLGHQKSLLLQLMNELIFESDSIILVKWNQSDECCNWYGVECDAAGNVISLQLDDVSVYGGIGDSSSLFGLQHLEKLNLAYNYFHGDPIPKSIHNLTNLTHLNLSNAAFGGQVPLELSFLRRLVSLDISLDVESYAEPLKLEDPNLEMLLRNLTGLRELYLDGVVLSLNERRKWSHIISTYLPNITSLSLRNCFLSGPFATSFQQLHSLSILRLDGNDLSTEVPTFFANFSSLTDLSLASCRLEGSFPNAIFHILSLQKLNLSENYWLSGNIPAFTQNGSLKSIILSFANFSGLLPSSISNLKALEVIDLSYCQFTGSIPSTFANLTQLISVKLTHNFFTGSLSSTPFGGLSNLVYLDLGANSFSGNIPYSLFGLPSLLALDLRNNKFIGLVEDIPIVNASNIVSLDLSGNRLEGPIPDSFFQLQSLESLLLHENLFNGTFPLDKIQSLANLTKLDLSNNNLLVDVGNDNYSSSGHGFPQLKLLRLASCKLNDFPNLIEYSDMIDLDLSNNRIAGEIPSWIWGKKLESLNLGLNLLTDLQKPYHIPASLRSLRLHSNQLSGELHLPIPPASNLWYLSLANNSLSESIPTSLCISDANPSILDLSFNKLSGGIPSCLVENINMLSLGHNNISGSIPDNFSVECRLQYLDLSSNNLHGKIPKSLGNCSLLEFMNVGNNNIDDTFPCMLSWSLIVLVLHSNRFHGEVKCRKSWPELQILDISSNYFSGSLESIYIPSFSAMVEGRDINLLIYILDENDDYYPLWRSGIKLIMKGVELELDMIWSNFGIIDISCNNFRGKIPTAIGDLSSLHYLNFSHNALNGSIPKSFGKLGELESLDLSGNQLTGPIPVELAGLTFLQVLNFSDNKLVGMIPKGRQFQTFSADSFEGNSGLCGFPLSINCTQTDDSDLSQTEHENVEEKGEIEWEYVSAALGLVVGLGSIAWLLVFCRSFREKYFDKIEEVVEEIVDGRNRRRRRARRAARNRVTRQ